MIASDILDRVSMQLNDQGRVRWTLPMLLNYLTDAMRQTVLVRPDANARGRRARGYRKARSCFLPWFGTWARTGLPPDGPLSRPHGRP